MSSTGETKSKLTRKLLRYELSWAARAPGSANESSRRRTILTASAPELLQAICNGVRLPSCETTSHNTVIIIRKPAFKHAQLTSQERHIHGSLIHVPVTVPIPDDPPGCDCLNVELSMVFRVTASCRPVWRRQKRAFLTNNFFTIFGLVVTLTFDLLNSKCNQFIFVLSSTTPKL